MLGDSFTFIERSRRIVRFRTPLFFQVERIIAVWFMIWFWIGLVVVAMNWRTPFGPWADFIFMALASSLILLHLARSYPSGRIFWAFLWTVVVSGAVEIIGTLTGFPFGPYAYTENFGPRLFGILPLAIPLAWLVVVWPVFLACRSVLVPAGKFLTIPVLTAFIAVWVDFILEPVATEPVRQYWLWESGGSYYGVPWINFVGWWFTAWLIAFGLQWLVPNGPLLRGRDLRVPLSVFGAVVITFLLSALTHLLWGPILLGIPLLALLVAFAWLNRHPGTL